MTICMGIKYEVPPAAGGGNDAAPRGTKYEVPAFAGMTPHQGGQTGGSGAA